VDPHAHQCAATAEAEAGFAERVELRSQRDLRSNRLVSGQEVLSVRDTDRWCGCRAGGRAGRIEIEQPRTSFAGDPDAIERQARERPVGQTAVDLARQILQPMLHAAPRLRHSDDRGEGQAVERLVRIPVLSFPPSPTQPPQSTRAAEVADERRDGWSAGNQRVHPHAASQDRVEPDEQFANVRRTERADDVVRADARRRVRAGFASSLSSRTAARAVSRTCSTTRVPLTSSCTPANPLRRRAVETAGRAEPHTTRDSTGSHRTQAARPVDPREPAGNGRPAADSSNNSVRASARQARRLTVASNHAKTTESFANRGTPVAFQDRVVGDEAP
jgi:hypothetical protein